MAQRKVTTAELEAALLLGASSRAGGELCLYSETLPDGRWVYLLPRYDGYRIGVSSSRADLTFQDIYDFPIGPAAWEAALGWDGAGDPEGWLRHVRHGEVPRRRPNGTPESEYRAP